MLSINEHNEVMGDLEVLELLMTDEIYENAAEYEIIENVEDIIYTVNIYDDKGIIIASCKVEDSDVAEAFLEEEFDIEQTDEEDDTTVYNY